MAAQGVIVRRLASIENFGSMDILCTDKTGTLTLGIVSLDHAYNAAGQDSDEVKRLAWLNSHFQTGMSNPLDEAVLNSIQEVEGKVSKMDEIPYDFFRKRLSVVVKENGIYTLICKGALEKVIEVCTLETVDGKELQLTADRLKAIKALFSEWSAQGYRVLGIASRKVEEKLNYTKNEETGLTFEGFMLFFDPPKPEVKETIVQLEKMGVKLKIITGDNNLVAKHTAETIGMRFSRDHDRRGIGCSG